MGERGGITLAARDEAKVSAPKALGFAE